MSKSLFFGWFLFSVACAQVTYYAPQHIVFPPGKLVRLWIRDRTITHLVGVPEHVVWSMEHGSLFFEAAMGCSFCVYDEFKTPYDITAAPQTTAKPCLQINAKDPFITPEHIQRFLLSNNKDHYKRSWRNASRHSVALDTLHKNERRVVVIAQKHHIAPLSTLTYFAVPKTALARY